MLAARPPRTTSSRRLPSPIPVSVSVTASATLFMRTWAAACRPDGLDGVDHSQAMPPPPVLDRSLMADPDDLLSKTIARVSRLASGPPPPPAQGPPPPSPAIASFMLTRDQIDGIKDAAVAHGARHVSWFMAASALAWVCVLRSRSAGIEGTARSHMLFSMVCRSRLVPQLPAEYFGNCLRPCFVEAAAVELISSSRAAAIGSAIKEMERGVLEGHSCIYFSVFCVTIYRVVPRKSEQARTDPSKDIPMFVCCVIRRRILTSTFVSNG